MKFKIDIKDKYIKSKNSIRKASASTSDMKNITGELFSKSNGLLKTLISKESGKGDIFHGFKILDNKLILSSAAYFLSSSYKFLQEKKTSENFLDKKKFDNERIFATYADGIYSKKIPPNIAPGLIELFKPQHKKGVLIPVHGIFKNEETKSIILAIRGTASPQDAIIDGLATTESVSLDEDKDKKYYVHSGFLRAATFIANQIAPLLKKIFSEKKHSKYTLTVTGHSLGGASATVTGVLLFDKHFNREIPINICGFASGTSFAAQKDGKPLEQYLKKYPKLKIKTFIYENDIVPRLSAFEIFVFLATCVSICKLIFLQQELTLFPNFKLTDVDRDNFLKKNPKTRNAIRASAAFGKAYRNTSQIASQLKKKGHNIVKKFWGGAPAGAAGNEINRKIIDIYKKLYSHFKNKFKDNGDFYKLFTSHPGKVLWIKNNKFVEINPYILQAKFKIDSLFHHLMNNYKKALRIQGGALSGGRRKTRRKKKRIRRKTKKKRIRRKRRTKRHRYRVVGRAQTLRTRKQRGGMTIYNDCPICYKTLNDNTKTVVTLHSEKEDENQHHLFHLDCIHKWFQKSHTCPNCRSVIKLKVVNGIEEEFQKEQEEEEEMQRRNEDKREVSLRKKAIFHRENKNGTWGRGGECCTPCKQSSWCDTITCKKPTCKKCNFDNYGNASISNEDVNCWPRS